MSASKDEKGVHGKFISGIKTGRVKNRYIQNVALQQKEKLWHMIGSFF